MRLSTSTVATIKQTITQWDPGVVIYLFGSRTDDMKKGGDIDLLVISQRITIRKLIDIKLALYDSLGEQKIDVILARETKKPFVQLVLEKGIAL